MKENIVEYRITIASYAEKEILLLPEKAYERVAKAIDSLRFKPRPHGTVKLKGKRNLYRIRVGDYRIIYSVDDRKRIIDISYVKHRSKAYRN